MSKANRKKIGLVFGGKSGEHEVSILSAAAVLAAIDREKYDAVPFVIDKAGLWYQIESELEGLCDLEDPRVSGITAGARRVAFADFDAMVDFAFPLLHGPYGEDGTIQGLFDMLGKPYAGCGVAAAALSMDKVFTKDVWRQAGLTVGDYTYTTKYACEDSVAEEAARIESEIPYPIFVKPANMGSSVGISKVCDRAALETAIETAFKYDKRVIAEKNLCGRELEIGVIGNGNPKLSAVGEILSDNVYYDYDSKYRGGGARLDIPADIPYSTRGAIEETALSAYKALDGEGFARIDMFYDEGQGKVYLSEMNAIPGFTRFSMFPRLWQAAGMGFTELVTSIIELGYERHYFTNHR